MQLTNSQQKVVDLVDASVKAKEPFFMHIKGGAGSGKSHIIKHLKDSLKDRRIHVSAMTGQAASMFPEQNATTAHRAFSLSLNPYPFRPIDNRDGRYYCQGSEIIIVDEVSMMSSAVMAGILNRVTGNDDIVPTGVIPSLIYVGDEMQLPPVVTDEGERTMMATKLGSVFWHSSTNQKWLDGMYKDRHDIKFVENIRQSNPEFVDALNCIREQRDLKDVVEFLNKNCFGKTPQGSALHLFHKNADVDAYNKVELDRLPGKEFINNIEVKGDLTSRDFSNVSETLVIKEGCQVMCTNNYYIGEARVLAAVNGDIGIVTEIQAEKGVVKVRLHKNGDIVSFEARNIGVEKVYEKSPGVWGHKETGSYKQIPLRVCYAITVAKAQGQTFKYPVVVHLGGWMPNNLGYVAISRVDELFNLFLTHRITVRDLKTFANGVNVKNMRICAKKVL